MTTALKRISETHYFKVHAMHVLSLQAGFFFTNLSWLNDIHNQNITLKNFVPVSPREAQSIWNSNIFYMWRI